MLYNLSVFRFPLQNYKKKIKLTSFFQDIYQKIHIIGKMHIIEFKTKPHQMLKLDRFPKKYLEDMGEIYTFAIVKLSQQSKQL